MVELSGMFVLGIVGLVLFGLVVLGGTVLYVLFGPDDGPRED